MFLKKIEVVIMYNINNQNITNYNSTIYIANKLKSEIDITTGNEKLKYDTPIKYRFNVQEINESLDIQEYGSMVNTMKIAVIKDKKKYLNKFVELSKVYLDNTNPDNEKNNGDNANYYIYAIRNQNTCIKLYFKKIIKNEEV